jgi:5-methylthioadenosine/S-adenosylhomocysteine deaminase
MHVLESKTQAISGQVLFGKTLVRHLHELGLLTERLTMNHAIWLTAEDIALMGAAGCSVTHNPLSNLKLGSGVCPVRALRNAGVNVAVATDGMATSDTADQIEALHLAAILHKIESFDAGTWLGASEAFEMATESGAKSCRIGDIGRLAPGLRADIALLDADHFGFIPLNDPIRQLCFSVGSEAVRTVMVDGRVVMRDRRMVFVDEDKLRAEIAVEAERFRTEVLPEMAKGAAVLRPYMDAIHKRATAQTLEPGHNVLRSPRIANFH